MPLLYAHGSPEQTDCFDSDQQAVSSMRKVLFALQKDIYEDGNARHGEVKRPEVLLFPS